MHTTVEEGRDQQQHLHPTNRHDVESIVGQSPWAPHWCSRENFILYEPADSVLFPHQNREKHSEKHPQHSAILNPHTRLLCISFFFSASTARGERRWALMAREGKTHLLQVLPSARNKWKNGRGMI